MQVWKLYGLTLCVLIVGFVVLIHFSPSPESQILGSWQELAWEYEKVDKQTNDHSQGEGYQDISSYVKSTIGYHLIVHKAETWTFLPDGKLRLQGGDFEETVSWRIKGRGHILELRHDDNTIEHYNLTDLGNQTMVLNFESDLQVRGIAKLTFKKI